MKTELEVLRAKAVEGDRDALERLVSCLVDDVYRIAVRMVWDRRDAEDATQEILTKVVTKLGSFEGRSSLKTWVYRVAVNHLLDRRRNEHEDFSFDVLAADLLDGLADPRSEHQPELEILAHEVKVTCTGAMLLCLDRPHRIAYLLGDILQLPGPVAADILEIDPAALRKRLQRARSEIRGFMESNCGLVASSAACRCSRRVSRAVELGRVDVGASNDTSRARKAVREIQAIHRSDHVMRSTLESAPNQVLIDWRAALDASPELMRD